MQLESLVQPKWGMKNDSLQAAQLGYELKFVPFTPDANTICTISETYLNDEEQLCFRLIEVKAYVNGEETGFKAEYWDEIAPPYSWKEVMELNEAIKC